MRTSVLVLCLSDSLGGLELHVRDYARWLAQQPDAELALALRRNSPLHLALADLGRPLFLSDGPPRTLQLTRCWRLARFLRAHRIGRVHCHDARDLPLASIAARLAPARLVITRHMGIGARKHDPWHRWLYARVDLCIAVSEWLAAEARAKLPLAPGRTVCIHPGVELGAPAPQAGDPQRFAIGMVARILPAKGQRQLLEAAILLRNRGVPAEVVYAGQVHDPGYWQELQAHASSQQVPLRYLGFVAPASQAYTQLDAVVIAAREESFGLATVEALRMHRPLVAARSGATPEIVRDGVDGLLYELEDCRGLADRLEQLWRDTGLRERLAADGARGAAERFDAAVQNRRIWDAVRRA